MVVNMVTSRLEALRNYASAIAVPPLAKLSRTLCLSLLNKIKIGQLEIKDTDGSVIICGDRNLANGFVEDRTIESKSPHTTLTVHKDAFWIRLLLFADMGFAESYMYGEVSCPDLTAFFKIFILNKAYLSGSTITASLANALSGALRATNNLTTARSNIEAHYDLSNAMFAGFLSKDMTYSCAIWKPRSDPDHAQETLEEAQMTKLDRFIDGAKLKSTDRVLEIGTGWGSLAIRAVQRTGCRVTSLTLSKEQKELAEDRIREAGLEDSIEVLLCDYRALEVPEEGPFDKVVSCEMLEAVGREYLDTYFECVDRLLKKDGGAAVFQCITIPEARYEAYTKSDDFIRRYIFPGGHLPTISQLVSSLNAGSKGTLVVDNVENIGPHYKKTLRLWNENFQANLDDIIKPALLREHEKNGWGKAEVGVFRRKWEYYFTYCEAGFATKSLGDHIITCSREGAVEMLADVPM